MKIPVAVFGATLFIAALGFTDDIRSIPVLPRLLLQGSRRGGDPAAPENLRIVRPVRSGSNAPCCYWQACGS